LKTFAEFGLSQPTLASLLEAGFTEPTEVQTQAIGIVMSGKDLMASAQTGSGKTAAYAVPMIDRLQKRNRHATRALVLVPTRELALQVKEQFVRFGGHLRTVAIYGGTGYHSQAKALKFGADVIIATPGRLLDLLDQGIANLSQLQTLVLDEADRLMDMGFMPQVRKVVQQVPVERQTLMFSATIDKRIEDIASEFLNQPSIVRSTAGQVDAKTIEQKIHYMKEVAKEGFLLELLDGLDESSVLIFTKTRRKASSVTNKLRAANVRAEEIHGDVSQNQRERIMARYRRGEFAVLVATDIAARGLDVPHISHVVNYDLPMCAQDYVHRIGRTGRAGRAGIAHSLVSDDQRHLLRDIERVIGRNFEGRPQLQVGPRPSGGPRPQQGNGGGGFKAAAAGRRRFRARRKPAAV
jgi:ATP-dependent RNA helicase RhlE